MLSRSKQRHIEIDGTSIYGCYPRSKQRHIGIDFFSMKSVVHQMKQTFQCNLSIIFYRISSVNPICTGLFERGGGGGGGTPSKPMLDT